MEKAIKLTTLTLEPLLLSYGARHPGQHSFHETFQDDSRSLVVQPPRRDSGQYPSILAAADDYREQCRGAACVPSHQISHPYYKLKRPFENSTKMIYQVSYCLITQHGEYRKTCVQPPCTVQHSLSSGFMIYECKLW